MERHALRNAVDSLREAADEHTYASIMFGPTAQRPRAREIADLLREKGSGVGLASIYRALDLLDRLSLVQRFEVGEGLEKKTENFADEVAKQAGLS